MPYDTDESYFYINEPGALAQEEADALEWEQHHRPAVVCPWDLPGSDRPLTPSQQAIFTPDRISTSEASAQRLAPGPRRGPHPPLITKGDPQ